MKPDAEELCIEYAEVYGHLRTVRVQMLTLRCSEKSSGDSITPPVSQCDWTGEVCDNCAKRREVRNQLRDLKRQKERLLRRIEKCGSRLREEGLGR